MTLKLSRPVLALATIGTLTACSGADHLGRPPTMTEDRSTADYMAMTEPTLNVAPRTPEMEASLWSNGQMSLVGDRRASERGDILTVVIQIDDRAEMTNTSGRTRTGADTVSVPHMMGIPQRLNEILPDGASADKFASAKTSSTYKGTGNISRRDRLTLRVAATVVETLPNGVLRIQGSQEVRVNFEMRELTVSGFVRPSDIGRNNEIDYDRIAGARISYGGRGQMTDAQQPRYGQQMADMILPY